MNSSFLTGCEENFGNVYKKFNTTVSGTHINMTNLIGDYKSRFENLNLPSECIDYTIKWIEDIALFSYYMVKSKDFTGRMLSVTTLIKLRFGDSPICSISHITSFTQFCDKLFSNVDFNNFEFQSMDTFDDNISSLRSIVDNYEVLKSKPIFEKIYKCIGYIMSMSICKENCTKFDPIIYKMLSNEYTYKSWGPDFVHSIVDLVLFIMERGLQCYKVSSLEPILHSGSEYDKWFIATKKKLAYADFLNNPEAHGIYVPEFMAEVELLLSQGRCLMKYVDKIDKRALSSILLQLEKLKEDQVGYDAALKDRKSPLGILVNGGSSVAKSSFIHALYIQYGLLFNLPVEPTFKYTRNSVDKHWNNFRTYKWCLVFDDVAFMHESRASEGDPSVMEILQILNNIAFIPAQASLEDKGRTPCWAKLAVFTTNTPHLNASNYFSCPLAVMRRFPIIIDLEPKDQYRKFGSEWQFIDGAKLPEVPVGEFPDFWNIKVYKPVPDGMKQVELDDSTFGNSGDYRLHQRAKFEILFKFDNIYDFMSWFTIQAKQHDAIQNKFMDFTANLRVNTLCKECGVPIEKCLCCLVCKCNKYSNLCTCEKFQLQSLIDNLSYSNQLFKECSHFVIHRSNKIKDIYEEIKCNLFVKPEVKVSPYVSGCFSTLIDVLYIYLFLMIDYCCSRWSFIAFVFSFRLIKIWFGLSVFNCDNQLFRKRAFQLLAETVKYKIGFTSATLSKIKVLGLILASFSMCYTIYKVIKSSNVNNQILQTDKKKCSLQEYGTKPSMNDFERPNAWPKESYSLSNYELSPLTVSWSKMPDNEFRDLLITNMKRIEIIKDEGDSFVSYKANMFGICDFMYICNSHSIPRAPFKMKVYNTINTSVSVNKTISVNEEQILKVEGDFTMLYLPNFDPCKNLVGLVPRNIVDGCFSAQYIGYEEDCTIIDINIQAVRYKRVGLFNGQHANVYMGLSEKMTKLGDCGSIMYKMSNLGPLILGFHYLGDGAGLNKYTCAYPLTRDKVNFAIKKLRGQYIEISPIILSKQGYKVKTCKIHAKSPVNFVESGVAKVICGIDAPRPKYTTNIVKSYIHDKLLNDGWLCKKTTPSKLDSWEPWFLGFKSRVQTANYFDFSIMKKASDAYYNDVINSLGQNATSPMLYDLHTAINGIDGMAHVNSIDWNTSMGFPYKKSKKYFQVPLDPNDPLTKFTFKDEILDEIQRILESYRQRTIVRPIFSASPKDEVITPEKDALGKIRIFFGANGPWTIVVRMATLWACRLIQNNPYSFEAAAGMQCMSDEWQVAFDYLTQFGENNIVAGDYAGYDTADDVIALKFAFDIILRYAKEHGASQEMLDIIECVAIDTTYNVVDYWGTMVMFIGCLPSGNPLTLIINCIKNSLYMRCAYLNLNPDNECTTFRQNVALLTMGDDNIMGVSGSVPWFNHTSISNIFHKVGIIYTMDDKEAESVPYINIFKASFVKRKFMFNNELGVHSCPLDLHSISKSLFWRMNSAHIEDKSHAVVAIGNALSEYAYYGKIIFNQKLNYFKYLVKDMSLEPYLEPLTFQPYESHLNRWCEHSKYVNYSHTWVKCKKREGMCGDVLTKTPPINSVTDFVSTLTFVEQGRVGIISYTQGRSPKSLFRDVVCLSTFKKSRFKVGCDVPLSFNNHNHENTNIKEKTIEVGSVSPSPEFQFKQLGELLQHLKYARSRSSGQMLYSERTECLISELEDLISDVKVKKLVQSTDELPLDKPRLKRQVAEASCLMSLLQSMRSKRKRNKYLNYKNLDILIFELELLINDDYNKFVEQADVTEATVDKVDPSAHVQGEQDGVMEFFDQYIGDFTTIPATMRTVFDQTDSTSMLGNWFNRPLLIDSYTWNIADTINTNHQINPWNLFFTNALNSYKLNNIPYIRCNLKLKITVNGTPFLYGTYLISYAPLQNSLATPTTPFGNNIPNGNNNQQFTLLTQLPHLWINPHDAKGGELKLPFIYNRNWLNVVNGSTEFTNMGVVSYNLVVPLQSANGATSSGVTVNTFCWAEDMEFSGATTTLAFQSKVRRLRKSKIQQNKDIDEYGEEGQISGPASAVAALANWFTGMPIIGPFATATEMGARAIAAGAAALGYTNAPVIGDIHGLKPVVSAGFANSEIGYQIEKLSIDPKNELTIDNSSIGLSNMDELNIQYLVTKEAYIGQFVWAQSSGEAAGLFSCALNPAVFLAADTTTYTTFATTYYATPLAYYTQLFSYWRGDIILRFKLIASQYHKGRLRVAWDPTGHGSTNVITTDSTNAVYSEIFDIGAEKDFEVRIPYMQPAEWSRTLPFQTSTTYLNYGSLGSFTHVDNVTNGMLTIRVMNELSAPSTSATATMMVFARAAENFELAGPATQWDTYNSRYTLFAPQASITTVEKREVVFSKPSEPKPERYLTNFGEGYVTLRQILRRTSLATIDTSILTDAGMNLIYKNQSRFPASYGWDPNGNQAATKQVGTGSAPFSYAKLHPMTWVYASFLGIRGSVNWFFDAATDSAQGTWTTPDLRCTRLINVSDQTTSIGVANHAATTDTSIWAQYFNNNTYSGASGVAYTDSRVQPVLSTIAPNYSQYFFQGTNVNNISNPKIVDGQAEDMISVQYSADLIAQGAGTYYSRLYSYAGIGADFNPVMFLHVPAVYVLATDPTPT